MEIEKEEEEECSTTNEIDNNMINIDTPSNKNNFFSEISSIKNRTITNQLENILIEKNIRKEKLNIIITNYKYFIEHYYINNNVNYFLNSLEINGEKDINAHNYKNFYFYAEKLIEQIYLISFYIKENEIPKAILEINSIHKDILNINKNELFALHRQYLIGLIKKNLIEKSITYAKEYLMPLVKDNSILYNELEDVISLLAFNNINKFPKKEIINDDNSTKNKITFNTIFIILKFLAGEKVNG